MRRVDFSSPHAPELSTTHSAHPTLNQGKTGKETLHLSNLYPITSGKSGTTLRRGSHHLSHLWEFWEAERLLTHGFLHSWAQGVLTPRRAPLHAPDTSTVMSRMRAWCTQGGIPRVCTGRGIPTMVHPGVCTGRYVPTMVHPGVCIGVCISRWNIPASVCNSRYSGRFGRMCRIKAQGTVFLLRNIRK